MVNIWDYANNKPRVKVKTVFGTTVTGNVLAVLDAEEADAAQDCIDIELDDGDSVAFYADEIESIEVLNDR